MKPEPHLIYWTMRNGQPSMQSSTTRSIKCLTEYRAWGHPGSLETPMAILWTAKKPYPERFSDLDLIAETKKFYQTYRGLKIDDELAGKILSGEGMRKPRQ